MFEYDTKHFCRPEDCVEDTPDEHEDEEITYCEAIEKAGGDILHVTYVDNEDNFWIGRVPASIFVKYFKKIGKAWKPSF